MIFASPFGASHAQAIGQPAANGLAPTMMTFMPQEQRQPFILPEDRVRVAAETFCEMRRGGYTESEIVGQLRRSISGITDVEIIEATAIADASCPAGPGFAPQQPQTAPPPPPPEFAIQTAPPPTEVPPVVIIQPPVGETKKWLILGGIAVGVLGLGALALYFAKKD